MPRTERLAVPPEVAPIAPMEIPIPAVKVPAAESKVDNSPTPSASVPMSPPVEFNPSLITDDGPGISSKAPMSDIIEDEQELAPITNSETTKDVWDKIEAGATAPIDSGLTARSIGSGTSEVSPFEEVPSVKSVAKASPAAEEASKQEPNVNTLDLTKLVPGKTYNYKVIDGPDKGTSGSFTVPTDGRERDIAGVYRGYLHNNKDGSFRFENINPNKCEVTALDGKRAESTISSNSSVGQASTEKASELSKKDIKKIEREEKREDRKLELSDGTKIKLGGKPPELTGAQVKDFLNKYPDQKALIIVGAEWCGPCRNYEPSYTEYAKRNPNVAVIHVDSDHNQEFVSSNSVSSLPTTLLKASGSTTISPIQDGHVGPMGVSELERRYGK
jgi:thiol-disulfide isomerase/thioredoxin